MVGKCSAKTLRRQRHAECGERRSPRPTPDGGPVPRRITPIWTVTVDEDRFGGLCPAGQGTPEEQPMRYVIAEPCIGVKDRSCVDVGPVDWIYEGETSSTSSPTRTSRRTVMCSRATGRRLRRGGSPLALRLYEWVRPQPHDKSSTEQSSTCPSMMRRPRSQQPAMAPISVE
jgi:hypothetical protein